MWALGLAFEKETGRGLDWPTTVTGAESAARNAIPRPRLLREKNFIPERFPA
jgi:hypothetical protein